MGGADQRCLRSSNGGVFGSLYGTPIINLPQAAVLGARIQVPTLDTVSDPVFF